jgi:serine/threonine-protein kinase
MDSHNIKPFDLETVKEVLRKRVTTSQLNLQAANQKEADVSANGAEQPIIGYRVLEKMGRGGMAVVFKAQNITTGEIVALKLLYPGREKEKAALQQFVNEGMMLIRLVHPNILRGLDFGVSKGMYFLALEFVEGESLDSFLEKGFLFTEHYAFEVVLQMAKALSYLQEKGIVHRDIKPANILLMEDRVKLCDFAFAMDTSRLKDDEGLFETTCGTVQYISPEQARGLKGIDIRSDVYSLGITCIHMITGKVPFDSKDSREVMRQQIYEPISLDKFKISHAGLVLLQYMVAKNREDRVCASRLVPMIEKFLCRKRG